MKMIKNIVFIFAGLLFFSGCTKDKPAEEASSKEIGFIYNLDAENKTFEFDPIEWIKQEDTGRIKELGLDANYDFPNGFYIYNPDTSTKTYKLKKDTSFQIVDWEKDFTHSETDLDGLMEHMKRYPDFSPPFWIAIEKDTVLSVEEQYVP